MMTETRGSVGGRKDEEWVVKKRHSLFLTSIQRPLVTARVDLDETVTRLSTLAGEDRRER